MVIKLNPGGSRSACTLQGLESVPVHTLLFKRPDDSFHHAGLLRAVRRGELLLQAVAANQLRVNPARINQTVVAFRQERLRHPAQRAETRNQRML